MELALIAPLVLKGLQTAANMGRAGRVGALAQEARAFARMGEETSLTVARRGLNGVVKNGGRNRLVPDINASSAHSVFRRDPMLGRVTHYETFTPQTNLQNPNPWMSVKRFDRLGEGHRNKILKENISTPHIHDSNYSGGVRYPEIWEVPK